jgi:DUF1680 family protein
MKSKITSGFWHDRLEVNAQRAIFHQWEQLEASGCIENFRIAAGDVDGFREGWFFADSDAYKWLDAASRIYASFSTPELASVMDTFITLIDRAQRPDGYLFTYNQIHFPTDRWKNLQIEHELYCHGHLIEAGVSHYEATARTDLLTIARRAADRIVEDFLGKGTNHTPGHEEIEIALLRLYKITDYRPYLEMARQFIEKRGRNPLFAFSLLKQNSNVEARGKFVKQKKAEYIAAHPDFKPFQLPPGNAAKKPRNATLRWQLNALSGKYFQQHVPVRKQTVPVGHSVRFAYFETAVAMLARENGDKTLVHVLEQVWERMVTRRMYVTGGIGSVPGSEGFGNDYELDPEYAYAETCAALASMFWNWEMAQLTNEAKYSDLLEWQLYNAAAVGMGLDGTSYLYNNPLTCRGGVTRKPWYSVPCCPSNLSRTWADLGKYIYSNGVQSLPTLHRSQEISDSETQNEIFIHQYISSECECNLAKIEVRSVLPWIGKVKIIVDPSVPSEFTMNLRLPSWCETESTRVTCNGEFFPVSPAPQQNEITASGYDPREGRWLNLKRIWNSGDVVELNYEMPILFRHAHPKVKGHQGKVAVTRGPLVYCLESVDNPNVDIFETTMDKTSLESVFDRTALGGVTKIIGQTKTGGPLTFIPYHLWGHRGESTMTVWVNE